MLTSMKTVIRFALLLVVAVVALVVASQLIHPESGGGPAVAPDRPPDTAQDVAEPAMRPADAASLRVDYVHDGDTLFLTDAAGAELKVRLIGVDTPELDTECFANEARDHLRALLPEGAQVWATHDDEPRDQYGRELLYLWTASGEFVNRQLVEEGFAEAVRIGANDAYWPQLSAAEEAARGSAVGLWGVC